MVAMLGLPLEASAYCPQSLDWLERQECLRQEEEERIFRLNDQQNQQMRMQDQMNNGQEGRGQRPQSPFALPGLRPLGR